MSLLLMVGHYKTISLMIYIPIIAVTTIVSILVSIIPTVVLAKQLQCFSKHLTVKILFQYSVYHS